MYVFMKINFIILLNIIIYINIYIFNVFVSRGAQFQLEGFTDLPAKLQQASKSNTRDNKHITFAKRNYIFICI